MKKIWEITHKNFGNSIGVRGKRLIKAWLFKERSDAQADLYRVGN